MEKWTVSRCVKCGVLSAPYFGFWRACREDAVGRHREVERIEVSEAHATSLFCDAWKSVPSFDRVNFDSKKREEKFMKLRRCVK